MYERISVTNFVLPLSEFYAKSKIVNSQNANKTNREVLRCGVQPQGSRISKIIYDQSTGNVYVKNLHNFMRNTY